MPQGSPRVRTDLGLTLGSAIRFPPGKGRIHLFELAPPGSCSRFRVLAIRRAEATSMTDVFQYRGARWPKSLGEQNPLPTDPHSALRRGDAVCAIASSSWAGSGHHEAQTDFSPWSERDPCAHRVNSRLFRQRRKYLPLRSASAGPSPWRFLRRCRNAPTTIPRRL
jgi:hypothetical protein